MHRVLEIGAQAYVKWAFPDETDFVCTATAPERNDPAAGYHVFGASTLRATVERLRSQSFDAVVVHAPGNLPVNAQGLSRILFSRHALMRGQLPLLRAMGTLLPALVRTQAPIALVDREDYALLRSQSLPLVRASTLTFKRELPADRWRLMIGQTGSVHPSPRFRTRATIGAHFDKLRPISLGLKRSVVSSDAFRRLSEPRPKVTDLFFAGLVDGNSTVRASGLREVLALREQGFAIDLPDRRLGLDEYLERCARAWIVWSPEGLGWDCFRHYEAPAAWSAPLIIAPSIERHAPLIDGVHALHYDTAPGGLTAAFLAAIADKDRLLRIAAAGRAHVLAHHTPQALAAHIVDATVEAAGRRSPAGR